MVRAILAGPKTQTRRIVDPQPKATYGESITHIGRSLGQPEDDPWFKFWVDRPGKGKCHYSMADIGIVCPYGLVGDRLWVREAWLYVGPGSGSSIEDETKEEMAKPENQTPEKCWYRASYTGEHRYKWTPSIHMFRWASRLLLEIKRVRCERLHDITELDALAEGVEGERVVAGIMKESGKPARMGEWSDGTARDGYRDLWNKINGKGAWDVNPWVWVIEFAPLPPPPPASAPAAVPPQAKEQS